MADKPPGDEPLPEGPQPDPEPTEAPGTEQVPGADVCAPVELIRATTEVNSLELSKGSSSADFSVTTQQYDGSEPVLVARASSFQGPLPAPSDLKGYEDVVPGSAREIISWMREESEHRRRLELVESEHYRQMEVDDSKHRRALEKRAMDLGERALNSGIFRANLGMFLSWPMMVLVILSGSYLVHTGHDKAGTTIVISGLTLVGGTYIVNNLKKSWDQQSKGKDTKGQPEDEDGKELSGD